MRIDNTSFFFNSSIKGGTATSAWGTAIGQSQVKQYKFNTEQPGLSKFLTGMLYCAETARNLLDVSRMSSSREIITFSIFKKVFVNKVFIKDSSFIVLLVKEDSKSHKGRRIISYPSYAKFNNPENPVDNSETITNIEKQLKIQNKCWFAYDISVENQDELHFQIKIVADEHKEYESSKERKKIWDTLVEERKKIENNLSSIIPNEDEDFLHSGLIYKPQLIQRFIASLLTKPFLLLSGLSGSGKTKLAEAFVKWICQDESQYKLIAVGADWTNREPLIGFPNALMEGEYSHPENGILELIIDAGRVENSEKPYFLILDEMNLSHVERYFADFLSAMESADAELQIHSNSKIINTPEVVCLPKNLFIIGTVNIDETTYMFSPKVLDRANTIEFRVSRDEIARFFDDPKEVSLKQIVTKGSSFGASFVNLSLSKELAVKDELSKTLKNFFEILEKVGTEFGFRTANEMLVLISNLNILEMKDDNECLDVAIMQKLLPKLSGSRRKLSKVLVALGQLCLVNEKTDVEKDFFTTLDSIDFEDKTKIKYPLSFEKITRMYRNARDNGFASYAEA